MVQKDTLINEKEGENMLKGNKVLLRSVERRDINIYYDMWSDEEVRKYDGGFVIPPSKEYLMENFNKIMNFNKKYLTIVNEKGVTIGYLTYYAAKDCKNVFEIGITIAKEFWNRNYGQDSIKTILKYLFMEDAAERVELEVLEDNKRAVQCYKKCGFIQEGIKRNRYFTEGTYKNVLIMGMIKEDFHKSYCI